MPPLIKGYLRVGARIGDGCVIDHEFRTVDVFIVMPVRRSAPATSTIMAGKPSASPPETAWRSDLTGAFADTAACGARPAGCHRRHILRHAGAEGRQEVPGRVKDADTVVLMCPLEEKEMLIEAAPEIYFETDHYKGWPAILVRVM